MKVALIVNPVAGQGRSKKFLSKVTHKFDSAGFKLDIYSTKQERQAAELTKRAIKDGNEIIVAVGGDGTVSEVINGVKNSTIKFGLIPSGTADVFAREMGIPTHNPFLACNIIEQGKTRHIDLGKIENNYFVLMAGVGFDAQVVNEIKPELKRLFKDIAYPLTGLRTLLTYRPSLMQIKTDSHSTGGYFVVVGNARFYAGRFSITRKARIDDGLLDVCVFKGKTMASFIKFIQGVATGQHLKLADVLYCQTKEIWISSEHRTLVQADGDVIGETPVKISIIPQSLEVLIP